MSSLGLFLLPVKSASDFSVNVFCTLFSLEFTKYFCLPLERHEQLIPLFISPTSSFQTLFKQISAFLFLCLVRDPSYIDQTTTFKHLVGWNDKFRQNQTFFSWIVWAYSASVAFFWRFEPNQAPKDKQIMANIIRHVAMVPQASASDNLIRCGSKIWPLKNFFEGSFNSMKGHGISSYD